jgi:NADPH:quinone reductase-like Zn-dependent oxidoreductase
VFVMLAITRDRYGRADQVLQLRELELPMVRDGELLVQVHASAVDGDDWLSMRGLPYVARFATGLRRPKQRVPGRDFAGQVVITGSRPSRYRVGDEVFGWCDGAFAEYVAVREETLLPKPTRLSFKQAAVVPTSGVTALQALNDHGMIQAGNRVLIIGASGGVGTFAVQIARAFGAHVTAVCSSENEDMVRAIGADRHIDYAQVDYTKPARPYDLIVDMVGGRRLPELRRALGPHGRLVMVGCTGGHWLGGTDRFVRGQLASLMLGQHMRPLIHSERRDDLAQLSSLIEAGHVTPIISATYGLRHAADAVRHHREGHARGKVAIRVAEPPATCARASAAARMAPAGRPSVAVLDVRD